jgi:hypothetical protein
MLLSTLILLGVSSCDGWAMYVPLSRNLGRVESLGPWVGNLLHSESHIVVPCDGTVCQQVFGHWPANAYQSAGVSFCCSWVVASRGCAIPFESWR